MWISTDSTPAVMHKVSPRNSWGLSLEISTDRWYYIVGTMMQVQFCLMSPAHVFRCNMQHPKYHGRHLPGTLQDCVEMVAVYAKI
jgi:hypothetical protein